MDYKRKYEIQKKITERLESEIDDLKKDKTELESKISLNESKMEIVEQYIKTLEEEISKAKDLKAELTKSVDEMRTMKRDYKSRLKSFLRFIGFNSISNKMKGY